MNTIAEILDRLKQGNKRFVTNTSEHKLQDNVRREALLNGQAPYAVILSCADSRVSPEIIFDTGLGELFVIRIAGNIANACSIASIEYALAHLNSKVVVVMGHQGCGAVTAAVKGGDNGVNLNHLLSHIQPAVEACHDGTPLVEVIQKNVALNIEHLTKNSTIIHGIVSSGKAQIVPAYYHLNGQVDFH